MVIKLLHLIIFMAFSSQVRAVNNSNGFFYLAPRSEVQQAQTQHQLYHYNVVHPYEVTSFHFSNYEKRVTQFIPRSLDLKKILAAAKSSAAENGNEKPIIVSIGSGALFTEFLLAKKGAKVIGIDPDEETVKKAALLYGLRETRPGSKIYVSQDPHLDLIAIVGDAQTTVEKLAEIAGVQILDYSSEIKQEMNAFQLKLSLFLQKYNQFIEDYLWVDLEGFEAVARDQFVSTLKTEYQQLVQAFTELNRKKLAFRRSYPTNIDVVFNSWMPREVDFRQSLEDIGANLLILVAERAGNSGITVESLNTYRMSELERFFPDGIAPAELLESGTFTQTYYNSDRYIEKGWWQAASSADGHGSTVQIYASENTPESVSQVIERLVSFDTTAQDQPYPWEYRDFWRGDKLAEAEFDYSHDETLLLTAWGVLILNFERIRELFGDAPAKYQGKKASLSPAAAEALFDTSL